jgi:hypothetical protein
LLKVAEGGHGVGVPLGLLLGEPLADGLGELLGELLGVGLEVGLGLGVGVAEPELTAPVHVVPLRVNESGTGLLLVQEPLNPKLVLPPVGIEPL